jgi:hypothetical protein
MAYFSTLVASSIIFLGPGDFDQNGLVIHDLLVHVFDSFSGFFMVGVRLRLENELSYHKAEPPLPGEFVDLTEFLERLAHLLLGFFHGVTRDIYPPLLGLGGL